MEEISLVADARILDWDSYWKSFKLTQEPSNFKKWKKLLLALNGSSWPVKSFLRTSIRVRGVLHITELAKDVILIAPEVVSKSINYRTIFRIILFKDFALVQDDEEEISRKFLHEYICPIIDVADSHVKEIRINAMKIRKLAGKITPIKLTLLVNNQTAGVEGLENITLTGQNIIRGIRTLKDRQEVDLKAESIGPWIELESDDLRFTMGKGIFLKNSNDSVWEIIGTVLK